MAIKSSGAGPSASDLTKISKPGPAKKTVTKKGKITPPEVTAQIIAALLSGQFQDDTELAAAVGTSKSNITKIKKSIPKEYLEQISAIKKDKIGQLVGEFLEGALHSLQRIDAVTLNEEWLFNQGAAELATFYGVKADKVIKILEAIERAHSEPDIIPVTEA